MGSATKATRMARAHLRAGEVPANRKAVEAKTRADLLAACVAMRGEGRPLHYGSIAERLGRTRKAVCEQVKRLRDKGEFPFVIDREKIGRLPATAESRRIRPGLATTGPSNTDPSLGPDEGVMAQIRGEWYASMINGRAEEDQTSAGVAPRSHKDHAASAAPSRAGPAQTCVAPRSHKDHAAWSRMRFDATSSPNYARTRHKAHSPRVNRSASEY